MSAASPPRPWRIGISSVGSARLLRRELIAGEVDLDDPASLEAFRLAVAPNEEHRIALAPERLAQAQTNTKSARHHGERPLAWTPQSELASEHP